MAQSGPALLRLRPSCVPVVRAHEYTFILVSIDHSIFGDNPLPRELLISSRINVDANAASLCTWRTFWSIAVTLDNQYPELEPFKRAHTLIFL